jgi:hypothetical protein
MCSAWLAMLWERGGNRNTGLRILCLPLIIIIIMTDNSYGGVTKYHFWGVLEDGESGKVRMVGELDHL